MTNLEQPTQWSTEPTSKFPLKALPGELLLEVADRLAVSSYASLALTCRFMYKLLDHSRWANLLTKDTQEWAQLVTHLATGPFEACASCQSLHHRNDRPRLEGLDSDASGSDSAVNAWNLWERPRYLDGNNVRQVALPAELWVGFIIYEPILDVFTFHVSALRARRLNGFNYKWNQGICLDRTSLEKSRIIPLSGAGKTVRMRCTTKAAFFQK
jgi:hypothetical protein